MALVLHGYCDGCQVAGAIKSVRERVLAAAAHSVGQLVDLAYVLPANQVHVLIAI